MIATIEEWMTLTEAGRRWNVSAHYLRTRIGRGTLTARKSDQIWLVSRAAMEAAYGPERSRNA